MHENTHILWGTNAISFLSEGIAMYAQGMATDTSLNDRQTLQFMTSEELYPLQEMMKFDIGAPGKQTEIGYPAAGSFVHFLIDRYGVERVHEVCVAEARSEEEIKAGGSWEMVYHRLVPQLEEEWHRYLFKSSWKN